VNLALRGYGPAMSTIANTYRIIALCVASAAFGAAATVSAVSIASPSDAPAPASQSVPHYLHGAYVLTDGKCPTGTVGVNASVRAATNSKRGHSTFPLCYVK
jgi:hypothetical protein